MTLNARHSGLALLLDLMMGIIQPEKTLRQPDTTQEVFVLFLNRNERGQGKTVGWYQLLGK